MPLGPDARPGRSGPVSFSIERYKEESKKVDTAGINWDAVKQHGLSKGDLFCLHYMMDIENHVPLLIAPIERYTAEKSSSFPRFSPCHSSS